MSQSGAALLVMDIQAVMLSYISADKSAALVTKVRQAIAHARENNHPVIFVRGICINLGAYIYPVCYRRPFLSL